MHTRQFRNTGVNAWMATGLNALALCSIPQLLSESPSKASCACRCHCKQENEGWQRVAPPSHHTPACTQTRKHLCHRSHLLLASGLSGSRMLRLTTAVVTNVIIRSEVMIGVRWRT